jgi:D-sedoheptulose 7-phosphate isomerase
MQNSLLLAIENCMLAIEQLKTPDAMQFIEKVSQLLATCFQSNHKVLIAGNGGSLCDATHFAE